MKDKCGIRGKVKYVLRDEHGNIKDIQVSYNDITVHHDAVVASHMQNPASVITTFGFIDFGTSTGGGTSDTGLQDKHGDSRIGVSKATVADGDDNDVVVSAFVAAGEFTGTLTESGLFQSSTVSDMMCYDDSTINVVKGAADTLRTTWTITYGSS